MAYYTTEFGGRFDTKEQAEEACFDDQTIEEFAEYFSYQVSFTTLLEWARRQENFYDEFSDEIDTANKEYLNEMIREWEEDE